MLKKVVIIGTGLMGGSLGLALRSSDPSVEVWGVDSEDTLSVALSRGAISHALSQPGPEIGDADVVFIGAPPAESLSILEQIAPFLRGPTVVSDMGSVKQPIARVAENTLSSEILFVGGHPMTGSERNGIRNASGLLFENATYVLCPNGSIPVDKMNAYSNLTKAITLTGARIIEMSAEKHDRIAARVSHIPQLLSVLLVNLAGKARFQDPEVLLLAAGGFRDMTRIASSPFPMWRDILEGNEAEILNALTQFQQQLEDVKQSLSEQDFRYVQERFHEAEQTRDFIPVDRKGFLKPLADIFVFASDRPGALVGITGALFEADLSIKDIELLRIREGTGGTFRLGFHTSEEADKAVGVLNESGFSTYRL